MKELTTRTAEGCRIASRTEGPYGPSCMEQIEFPPPRALGGGGWTVAVTEVLERLLPHLERGVLLWVAPEGVFMKRQCQGRVYWNGPLAPHQDWPNKLEREKTYKLLDTQQFLEGKCPPWGPSAPGSRPHHGSHPLGDRYGAAGTVPSPCGVAELRRYLSHGQPAPQYQIHLCFGEEYPTSTGRHLQKLIMAHVSTHRAADPRARQRGDGGHPAPGTDPILPAAPCPAGGAGICTRALPPRPAPGSCAAAGLPPALRARCPRAHRPRPAAALPALSRAAEGTRSLGTRGRPAANP